jgi:hypothetical protein
VANDKSIRDDEIKFELEEKFNGNSVECSIILLILLIAFGPNELLASVKNFNGTTFSDELYF